MILFFFLLYVVPQFESVLTELREKLNAGAAFALTMSTLAARQSPDPSLGVAVPPSCWSAG